MPELPVWLDGALLPAAQARVSVFDHGLTVGDGVFETLKAVDGQPFAVRRHLARLRRSAKGLGIDVPCTDDELCEAMAAVLGADPPPLARVRLTVTGGTGPLGSNRAGARPTVVVAASPTDPPPTTTAAVVAPWRRNEHDPVAGLKTTSYAGNVIALAYAQQRGASEALLGNTAGDLCEGTGANVFVVLGGELLTPPLESGCLQGITRDLVLQTTSAAERTLPLGVLGEADEVFITSSVRDIQGLDRVDDHRYDAPGPVTQAAMAAFAALASNDVDP